MSRSKKRNRLRVGNQVLVPWGRGSIEATVVEDRGDIGMGGRQLVTIRIPPTTSDDEIVFEVAADDVERAST
jgi:hypothetical protein